MSFLHFFLEQALYQKRVSPWEQEAFSAEHFAHQLTQKAEKAAAAAARQKKSEFALRARRAKEWRRLAGVSLAISV
jgi:hypothetical protein